MRWYSHRRGMMLPDGVRWRYRYDAFGRRINKVREGQVPSAQGDSTQPHYIVTDLTGTARELCSEEGEIRWRGEQGLWGAHREERRPIPLRRYLGDAANEEVYCELRYQGQLYDAETGLYYNRHRYYDAESGQYLSPDPIGSLGGIRPQGYVHNPLEWVDPLGLSGCPIGYAEGTGESAFTNPKRVQHAARHLTEEGILPNWNKATAQKFKDMGVSILENPKQTFDHVLRDGNAVKGFTGVVDGKTVAYMVYKTGPNQGQIATSIVPSAQQAANWGLKL